MENTRVFEAMPDQNDEFLDAHHHRFLEWAADEKLWRSMADVRLTDYEAFQQDIESYENDYVKPLGQTAEALAWFNLRHNVLRRLKQANYYPIRRGPVNQHVLDLQAFTQAIYTQYVENFEQGFWYPYLDDDHRELTGLPHSNIDAAIGDYRWMLFLFDKLIDASGGEDQTWDLIKSTYTNAHGLATGFYPPANFDEQLGRPSLSREVETLVWGESGSLVSTGVAIVQPYNP
ncbi:hypothetical protein N431DRAFT_465981 [Stipitochalara longipes BDJ]|nr:hypothetical protein N431DRAFT_465981 [Stipitochalara longipes BDJ]